MIEQLPLITIIVAVYNGEKFLPECIESVIKQNYHNLEIILVNDGSTDNSAEIIENYRKTDERIKVIEQKNSGVSIARNAALEISTGEYICFLDQDDCLKEDYIYYFYSLIKKYNSDIAVTPTVIKFTGNNYSTVTNFDDTIKLINGENAAKNMLYYNFIIAPWNKMISSKLINNNNIRFKEGLFSGEGFLFSIECFLAAKKVTVGQRKVYCYRLDNPNSGMTKFNISIINNSIKAQKIIFEKINKTPELIKACRYANWHTHCDCLNMMIGCNVTDKHLEKFTEIKKVCRNDALCSITAPIPFKEKIKCVMYFISPVLTSKVINKFRLRKFTRES